MSGFVVPDMIDPIVAWRCWKFDAFQGAGAYLSSLNGTAWPIKQRMDATCPHDGPMTRMIPGWWLVTHKSKTWYRDADPAEQDREEVFNHFNSNPFAFTSAVATSYVHSFGSMHIEPSKQKIDIELPPGYRLEHGFREETHESQHGDVPAALCQCGIYALTSRKKAESYQNASGVNNIIGEVFLWGTVVNGTKGYRAQYAYPRAFYNVPATIEEFISPYGVPMFSEHPSRRKRFVFF
jgi:hypothetical protein